MVGVSGYANSEPKVPVGVIPVMVTEVVPTHVRLLTLKAVIASAMSSQNFDGDTVPA